MSELSLQSRESGFNGRPPEVYFHITNSHNCSQLLPVLVGLRQEHLGNSCSAIQKLFLKHAIRIGRHFLEKLQRAEVSDIGNFPVC